MSEELAVDASGDLKAWRTRTRHELIASRMAASGALRSRWSDAIDRHLEALLPNVAGRTVGFCWPYKAEYDPRPTVLGMLSRGARAALPVIVAQGAPLAFREWHPQCEMEDGPYGIPVPIHGTPECIPDLVLLPANGFDALGYRLGYGAGYFDRTLASLAKRPLVIGISFELGRLATIYPQAHDIPLDYFVTERGAYRRGATGLEPTSGARQDPDCGDS